VLGHVIAFFALKHGVRVVCVEHLFSWMLRYWCTEGVYFSCPCGRIRVIDISNDIHSWCEYFSSESDCFSFHGCGLKEIVLVLTFAV